MAIRRHIVFDINAIQRLRKLLEVGYKVPMAASVLFIVLSYFLSFAEISNPIYSLLLFIIFSPSVLLTPFFIFVLYREKRFGWLAMFFIIVILPAILGIIILQDQFQLTWMFFLVFPFFFFCFFIKYSVDEWIREYNWHQQFLLQKKEQEERKKEGLF